MKNQASIRIDKWLWAARFFKTRALAVKALKSSHVKLIEGDKRKSLKPANEVQINQVLEVQRGPFSFTVIIKQISKHRGPAKIAETLYEETPESIKAREVVKTNLQSQPRNPFGGRKPDKHTVRKNRAIKRGF